MHGTYACCNQPAAATRCGSAAIVVWFDGYSRPTTCDEKSPFVNTLDPLKSGNFDSVLSHATGGCKPLFVLPAFPVSRCDHLRLKRVYVHPHVLILLDGVDDIEIVRVACPMVLPPLKLRDDNQ